MRVSKPALSWAFYDWANSAFATTVMAGFFPIFFKQYWSLGTSVSVSTFYLGMVNSVASIIVALLAPFLGSIADEGNAKKRFLFFFATLGVVMTGALGFVAQGNWLAAALLYVFALIGFAGGNIFYDSLLVTVADRKDFDFVSTLGYSLGYLGGGILFGLNVLMTLRPGLFGIASGVEAVRLSFFSVAVWWALFSLPLFLLVREERSPRASLNLSSVRSGLHGLLGTFREIRKYRTVFFFLIGYWLYIDGVDTIVLMAIDYGLSLGFDSSHLITALLITQFVGFPAAIAFGKIARGVGAKNGIFIGLAVYILMAVGGFFMKHVYEFYGLAIGIGLVQGGVQALSRSLYARLVPKERAAEFFGFYNMLGKFAAILGPMVMGVVSRATGNPRLSIFSVVALFVSGAILLSMVKTEKE
jgi:MFS transporter, UMF1 family